MFSLRVSSKSKPTGQFFCKFVSLSAKENRRSLPILSSRCTQSFNSMQITNFRSLFLSSRLEKSVMITFVKDDGTEVKRRAQIGQTLKDLVKEANPGVPCYERLFGLGACSKCHVIFSKEIFEKLEPATSLEEDLLLDLEPDCCATSRLGCCVKITEYMDGIFVRLPTSTRDERPVLYS